MVASLYGVEGKIKHFTIKFYVAISESYVFRRGELMTLALPNPTYDVCCHILYLDIDGVTIVYNNVALIYSYG